MLLDWDRIGCATQADNPSARPYLVPYCWLLPLVAPQASAARLDSATKSILQSLETVNEAVDCRAVYALWMRARASICCDFSYGVAVVAISRLITAIVLVPATISAIAGYKRFRRVLWGPYATVQALEVGAYL